MVDGVGGRGCSAFSCDECFWKHVSPPNQRRATHVRVRVRAWVGARVAGGLSQVVQPLPTQVVKSAHGVYIDLEDEANEAGGHRNPATLRLVDGMSSWWACIHGYAHPALNAAMHKQIDTMSHVMFGGLTHRGAVELGRRLVHMTPTPLEKVFLCDSGVDSVWTRIDVRLGCFRIRQRACTVPPPPPPSRVRGGGGRAEDGDSVLGENWFVERRRVCTHVSSSPTC